LGNGTKQGLFKVRSTSGEEMHEKLFDFLSHQGNANKNYIEILPQPNLNDFHPENKLKMLVRI
jgi:hypothetical protein